VCVCVWTHAAIATVSLGWRGMHLPFFDNVTPTAKVTMAREDAERDTMHRSICPGSPSSSSYGDPCCSVTSTAFTNDLLKSLQASVSVCVVCGPLCWGPQDPQSPELATADARAAYAHPPAIIDFPLGPSLPTSQPPQIKCPPWAIGGSSFPRVGAQTDRGPIDVPLCLAIDQGGWVFIRAWARGGFHKKHQLLLRKRFFNERVFRSEAEF